MTFSQFRYEIYRCQNKNTN